MLFNISPHNTPKLMQYQNCDVINGLVATPMKHRIYPAAESILVPKYCPQSSVASWKNDSKKIDTLKYKALIKLSKLSYHKIKIQWSISKVLI